MKRTGATRVGLVWCVLLGCVLLPLASAQVVTGPVQDTTASVSGDVADMDGVQAARAAVVLHCAACGEDRRTTADEAGHYSFEGVPAGAFTVTARSAAMADATATGTVSAGQHFEVAPLVLNVAGTLTSVDAMTTYQAAELELRSEEHQRLFAVVPNFFVAYDFHAPPLTSGQKFKLASRTVVDPVNFAIVGGIAGLQQVTKTFPGYGYGAAGYGKRFGAGYGDVLIGTYLGGALFPTMFHQDPRYFYMGTGTKKKRFFYALSTAVIARGDNGKWQPAYAGVGGDLATGAISNWYYPASSRQGGLLIFENGLLNVAFDGVGNVVQEFLFKHVSSGTKKRQ